MYIDISSDAYVWLYVASAVLLALLAVGGVVWLLRYRAFRRLVREQSAPLDGEKRTWPLISVIVVSQEHAVALKGNLPMLLTQAYPNYEVIVVNAASTDNTKDVIKELELAYDHLRHTFISPDSQIRDMYSFALMLGCRKARGEWVLPLSADQGPDDVEWLMRMARHIDESLDMVVGTTSHPSISNICMRKDVLCANKYSLRRIAKGKKIAREWSSQACIYQRE